MIIKVGQGCVKLPNSPARGNPIAVAHQNGCDGSTIKIVSIRSQMLTNSTPFPDLDMKNSTLLVSAALCAMSSTSQLAAAPDQKLLPIPEKLVVLTFDDGNLSDLTTVAPILKGHGFGATFFITSGWLGGEKRLTWAGVLKLQEAGFEIGNHTVTHPNLLRLTKEEIRRQVTEMDRECTAHGITKPTAFSYPGGHFDRRVLASLKELGYLTARRGRDPEGPLEDDGGNGRAYVPGDDHPFLIPSAMTRGIGAQEDERIVHALAWATEGKIAVLTYHGVPDVNRHCSTPIERFRKDMQSPESFN